MSNSVNATTMPNVIIFLANVNVQPVILGKNASIIALVIRTVLIAPKFANVCVHKI